MEFVLFARLNQFRCVKCLANIMAGSSEKNCIRVEGNGRERLPEPFYESRCNIVHKHKMGRQTR